MRPEVLDRMSHDEAHLPPHARTWARLIIVPGVPGTVLELRDPASGLGWDPSSSPRRQYVVARERLWRRQLPPAPLADIDDQSRWADDPAHPYARTLSRWELVAPGSGLPWEWAGCAPYVTQPRRIEGEWEALSGTVSTVAYEMPAADPWDAWADVTGVPCPLCGQILIWYEAGYVPGYRVCYGRDGIRHRWLAARGLLILV